MASMPGFKVNKETIGLVMGIVAFVTAAISAYNWLLAGRAENSPVVRELVIKDQKQDQRLDRTDEDRAATKELSTKTEKLTEAVVKLTTVIEQNGQVTKRVEYEPLYPSPARQALTYEVR